MYEQYRLKELRRAYGAQGWALLIYYGILNVAVMIIMFAEAFKIGFSSAASGQELSVEQLTEELVANSAWGYFIAMGVGLLILLLWKKPRFFGKMWTRGKPMKVGSFLGILVIFTSAQLFVQLLYMLLEYIFNLFGLSIVQAMESAGGSMDSLGMFLYVGLGAPVSEELLFRGLVLRGMEPYGKKFAIFASAFLFGLYHGNIIQIPFAFLVGLVLAYVTLEHNIGWAILLHLFNNLIFSDTLMRLTSGLPQPWPDLIFWIIMIVCTLAAVIVLLVKRKQIKDWLHKYQNDPLCVKGFWSAPGIITLIVILGVMTVYSTVTMILPVQ